ncbi:hypothetical protein FB451DRAFT_1556171 [Mycena latifolia]|nr:hypothetical protein FB451DRAFT_1556171 [Mycena latifolia]
MPDALYFLVVPADASRAWKAFFSHADAYMGSPEALMGLQIGTTGLQVLFACQSIYANQWQLAHTPPIARAAPHSVPVLLRVLTNSIKPAATRPRRAGTVRVSGSYAQYAVSLTRATVLPSRAHSLAYAASAPTPPCGALCSRVFSARKTPPRPPTPPLSPPGKPPDVRTYLPFVSIYTTPTPMHSFIYTNSPRVLEITNLRLHAPA